MGKDDFLLNTNITLQTVYYIIVISSRNARSCKETYCFNNGKISKIMIEQPSIDRKDIKNRASSNTTTAKI